MIGELRVNYVSFTDPCTSIEPTVTRPADFYTRSFLEDPTTGQVYVCDSDADRSVTITGEAMYSIYVCKHFACYERMHLKILPVEVVCCMATLMTRSNFYTETNSEVQDQTA